VYPDLTRVETRVGADKMPDAKTIGHWAVALGPAVINQIQHRIVKLAYAEGILPECRMRVDIRYPTDSSLLGDGVRVLTRTMKKITSLAGTAGARLRDRSRSVKRRLLAFGRAVRGKVVPNPERLASAYGILDGLRQSSTR